MTSNGITTVEYFGGCPECGDVIRERARWSTGSEKIANEWLKEQAP